jgi:hypothetical protein
VTKPRKLWRVVRFAQKYNKHSLRPQSHVERWSEEWQEWERVTAHIPDSLADWMAESLNVSEEHMPYEESAR